MTKWISVGVLASMMLWAGAALAQSSGSQDEETLTGCLNPAPGQDGQFVLTVKEGPEKGQKLMVTGVADLEKHAKNHTVKLTGTMKEENGKDLFQVSKVEHVAATCEATTE